MLRVSIIGASGYTGGELIKLLLRHPRVELSWLTSEKNAGKKISDVHMGLKGRCDLACRKLALKPLLAQSDLVFSCLPHGTVYAFADEIIKKKKRLIDLSADFRLKDPALYQSWYNFAHTGVPLLARAAYGLPERYRSTIKKARLVANPGCYATASLLALLPVVAGRWIEPYSIIIDAKSGVSGAGRKPHLTFHFPEANENIIAYKVAEHRHTPEIEQELGQAGVRGVRITFVPHLIPVDRGIMVTCYTRLKKKMSVDAVYERYTAFYQGMPFIHLLPPGEFPPLKAVVNTNYFWLGMRVVEQTRELIVVGVIDNLLKGASGQAVQNMNIMCGFAETTALL